MSRGNFSGNRGAKTLAGRLNQLRGLRNVGIKMATDKQYLDQLYEDGMDFKSKKRKREAAKLDNQFRKVVKENIIEPHMFNKDYDAPKEWAAAYEDGREEHQLTIEEAQRIHSSTQSPSNYDPTRGYSVMQKETKMRRYGYKPGLWSPSPSHSSHYDDYGDDDTWYNDYARKQRSKGPIY
ncbi:MAG: hypothetical protein ACJZ41_05830 [Candidatus Pelagibacterales bacterium]|mgnify:FL=1|jgi:hypothetical protein